MSIYDAHGWSNQTLLSEFSEAAGKLGASNSGLVIDVSLASKRIHFFALKATVFARMEGKEPPFKNGDKVRAMEAMYVKACLDPEVSTFGLPMLKQNSIYTVHSTYYQGTNFQNTAIWFVALQEMRATGNALSLFDSRHLQLVP